MWYSSIVERSRAQRLGALLVCAAGVLTVGAWWFHRRRPQGPRAAPVAPFTGQWLGCKRLGPGRCARDPARPLRLFVEPTHGPIRSATRPDGTAVAVHALGWLAGHEVYAVDGEPRGAIDLSFDDGTRSTTTVEEELTSAAIAAVDERRKKGLFDLAIAEADAALMQAHGREALRLLSLSARAALAGGMAAEAVKRLSRAEKIAHDEHFEDDEATERLVRAYVQTTRLGALTEAIEALGDTSGFWRSRPQHDAHRRYYRGLASNHAGDARHAIHDLRMAIDAHALLGNTTAMLDATSTLAGAYAQVGRVDEAVALVERTSKETPELQSCTGVFFANNATFAALRSAEHHAMAWRSNASTRETALRVAAEWIAFSRNVPASSCSDRAARSLTQVHDAELSRIADDAPKLAERVRAARDVPSLVLPVVGLAWLELDLDLAVRANRARDAERLAVDLLREAASLDQPHSEWAAHVSRARLHRQRDDRLARASLEAAERVLDRTLRNVAVGDGRNAFLTAHELSAAMLFELLLEAGEFDAAEEIANVSARRALDSATASFAVGAPKSPTQEHALRNYLSVKVRVEEASAHDWELPASEVRDAREARARTISDARRELEDAFARGDDYASPRSRSRSPAREAIRLVLHPIPRGYALLVRGDGPDRILRVESPMDTASRERVATSLLVRALPSLHEGQTIHLTAYGPLRRLDWPRLAVDADGTPLARRFAFVEHLGLPPAAAATGNRKPIVVADATSDLPFAAREGAFVREHLAAEAIIGGDATRPRVQEALETSGFFHYAGHGRFAGADGFESELVLAGGNTLAVSDVLLLARTPSIVVLSGCELAKSDDASGESFGIAQALLSRGTSYAIAPSRTVKDALAERFVRALYTDGPFDEHTVAARMHRALAQLARDVPGEDWSTFRLLAR